MDWRSKYRPYIAAGCLAFIMTMFIAPEVMEGSSMSPTLKDGQVTIITKESYSAKRGVPELGQVVVLEKIYSRAISDDNVIGRVVALPGDKLKVKNGVIYRKGEAIADAPEGMEDQTIKISKDDVYILTDNDDPTMDSRNSNLGPVDMKEIRGNVKLIIWPLSDIGMVN